MKKLNIEKVAALVDDSLHTVIFKAYLGLEQEWYGIIGAAFNIDGAELMEDDLQNEGSGPCFITGVGYQEDGIYERVNAICWGGSRFIIGDDAIVDGNTFHIQNASFYSYNADTKQTDQIHWEERIAFDLSDAAIRKIIDVTKNWSAMCDYGVDDNGAEYFNLKAKSGKLPKSFEQLNANIWTEGLTDWDEIEELSKQWSLSLRFGT